LPDEDERPAGPAQPSSVDDVGMEDDPEQAAQRLERALERIATAAHSARPTVQATGPTPAARELADRLDSLIAQLRAALGPT